MRRSCVFIPLNIPEGTSRSSGKEFNSFVEISPDSAFEPETRRMVVNALNFIESVALQKASKELKVWVKMTLKIRTVLSRN